ncbi:unnamed protein product [Brachionus calyciflorus]|uniref:PPPDE domain-containing protein n=1 Tax=Brachionus calyciflorus TaxID=104777 RepID=A0A813QFH2_9BILA|nr:unnamed protein product [Brachionus calyciflorus]
MSDLYLHVYDLSKGMAKRFSAMFLGKHFDGVWHTGIVAYENEWYFGSDGISCCLPKATILGDPDEILHLGKTELKEDEFLEIINQLRETTFKIGTYNLLDHNCNNFSNELSNILVGKSIPQHIIDLPKEVLNSPIGPMLRPLLEQAADPIHQHKTGTSMMQQVSKQVFDKKEPDQVKLSTTLILFENDLKDDFKDLLNHSKSNSLLNNYETDLFIEIQNFIDHKKEKNAISNSHLKLLFDMYFNLVKDDIHRKKILLILQNLSLNEQVAELIIKECSFVNVFVTHLEDPKSNDLVNSSLQFISNMCIHKKVCEYLLDTNHQDQMFKHLINYTHVKLENDIEKCIFEAAISALYNLISNHNLEKLIDEMNALSLGCMLLERFNQLKVQAKSVYHLLSLLRSCLTNFKDVRDLAMTMNFDTSKINVEQNGEIQSILNNIEKLVHTDEH